MTRASGMDVLGGILYAAFCGAGAGLVSSVLVFLLVVRTDTCDPKVYTCDLAPIAGIGLGGIVGVLVAMITGWLVVRRLARQRRAAEPEAIQGQGARDA